MKKVWALVLSLAMILTLASFPTFAAESQKLDLAAIATITAVSDGGQPVGRMVDSDLSTTWEDQWSGDENATTAIFQLNGLYNIDKIVVYAGGGTGTAPKDIKVEVSADGTTYTEIAYENYEETQVATEINKNYKWGGVTSTFDSLTATNVNYVRLTMTRNGYRLALREVEMYGTFKSVLPSPVKIVNATTTLVQDAGQADCTLEKSYDGRKGTAFLSGSSSGYVTFELDKWYDLSTFDISFGLDSWATTDMSPKKFNVSVSSDGVDFTQAYTYSADAGLGAKLHTLSAQAFDADVAKNVKFIRFELVERADWEFGLTEFSAIGTALNVASVEYTVNYVDIYGNSIAAAKNGSALSGATVSESPISITGYTPVGIGAAQTLSISDNAAENVLTFVYYNSAADKATVASAESSVAAFDNNSSIEKSYDGKDSTSYVHNWTDPGTKDRRIVWELDREYDLNAVAFVWPCLWNTNNSAAQIYRVAVSSDGLVWHTVERVNDTTDVTGTTRHDAYAISAKNVKYVRILIDQAGSSYMALGEAKFFGTPSATATGARINPVNVSTSATTDTPADDTITNAYENMFDGDKDTAWWSTAWAYGSLQPGGGTDMTLTFTLENITSLDTVRFGITGTKESWGNQEGSLTAFDLYVSSNGADYTKVYNYNGDKLFARTRSGSTSDGIIIDEFTGDVSAVKYIKLTMTYGSRTAINEFYVTGTENTSGLFSKGAQMRLDNGTVTAGLRFATTIDKATYGIGESYSYADNNGVTFGMYLLPTDKLGEYSTLLEYINANTLGDAVNVVGKNVYSQDANALTYTAVLTQIPETGYNRDVVALPYVISNGTTVYGTEMTRSYYSVAKAMRTSGAELTEAQIAALDAIINAVEKA